MANIVVGVTGGIAAYKSAPLIRLFSEAKHQVRVVATENALRFIGKTTLEALSKNTVDVVDPELFTDVDQVKHIAISKAADLIVVAPATASFMAKIAAGIADDLLTTTVLAASCKVVLAPAMHTEMWESQATKHNLEILQERGFIIVPPGTGRLTGSDEGVGRLAEPEDIFSRALGVLVGPLSGKKILVTAGGTRESIDTVRFIGNYSSGKQGIAFAEAAKLLGAEVRLILANGEILVPAGIEVTRVSSTAQLQSAMNAESNWFDALIMAAAVSDYRPAKESNRKLKSEEIGSSFTIELVENPDLLKSTVENLKSSGRKALTVGFAAETSKDLESLAKIKLNAKGCDFIIANDVSGGQVFGQDDTSVVLVSKDSTQEFEGSKSIVAQEVLLALASKIGGL